MKKIFLLAIFISLGLYSYANDSDFSKSLKDCLYYTESGQVNTDGVNVQTTKQILGWNGNKCTYKEKMQFSGMNVDVTCNFNKSQLQEISSVIDAYSLVQQYSGETVDTKNSQEVQNNPVVKVWNKYLQNSSVCNISGLQ